MAIINKKLTDAEKAAIYLHVYGGVNDWPQLYAIADGIKDKNNLTVERSTVYRWKNLPKIQTLIESVQREKITMLEDEKRKGFEDGKNSLLDNVGTNVPQNGTRQKFVDYTDPANQNRKLNELVNTSGDNGEILDALKVIMQAQKADREAAKTGKSVSAYVPITCADCPLYQKAKKKVTL